MESTVLKEEPNSPVKQEVQLEEQENLEDIDLNTDEINLDYNIKNEKDCKQNCENTADLISVSGENSDFTFINVKQEFDNVPANNIDCDPEDSFRDTMINTVKRQGGKKCTKTKSAKKDKQEQRVIMEMKRLTTKRNNIRTMRKIVSFDHEITGVPFIKKVKKLSDLEEKRRKKREIMRKYRAKLSEAQIEKKREYDRKYKQKRMEEGTWKTRANMSEEERRRDKKLVNERVRRCRRKQKLIKTQNRTAESILSPISSEVSPTVIEMKHGGLKRNSGRKKKQLDDSDVYRELEITREERDSALKLAAKYKKRLQRFKAMYKL